MPVHTVVRTVWIPLKAVNFVEVLMSLPCSYFSIMYKTRSLSQGQEDLQPDMLVHSGSPSIQETAAERSKFKASLLYVARSCLKNKQKDL